MCGYWKATGLSCVLESARRGAVVWPPSRLPLSRCHRQCQWSVTVTEGSTRTLKMARSLRARGLRQPAVTVLDAPSESKPNLKVEVAAEDAAGGVRRPSQGPQARARAALRTPLAGPGPGPGPTGTGSGACHWQWLLPSSGFKVMPVPRRRAQPRHWHNLEGPGWLGPAPRERADLPALQERQPE